VRHQGVTFGSISARFGLTNNIIDQGQYTILVTAVIGSAVLPTLMRNGGLSRSSRRCPLTLPRQQGPQLRDTAVAAPAAISTAAPARFIHRAAEGPRSSRAAPDAASA